MKRSLIAILAIMTTVCGSSLAHADLDSLLGDWTAAASQDTGRGDNATDLTVVPKIDGVAEVDTNFAGDFDGNDSVQSAGRSLEAGVSAPKTLASAHGLQPDMAGNGDPISSPQANPYYTPGASSCDCGNSDCRGSHSQSRGCLGKSCFGKSCFGKSCFGKGCFGKGCGEIVPRDQVCHLEGQSECRPHRRPLLPPPTSMLQLFRSKNTYSTVWAGYADETRDRMRNKSPHLNGTWNTCDDGGLIEPACKQCEPNRTGCDAGH